MRWDPRLLTKDLFDSGPSDLASVVKNPLVGPCDILHVQFGVLATLVLTVQIIWHP